MGAEGDVYVIWWETSGHTASLFLELAIDNGKTFGEKIMLSNATSATPLTSGTPSRGFFVITYEGLLTQQQDRIQTLNSEIMQIITGAENITEFNLQHFATTQVKIDACFDNIFPSIIASDERIKNGMTELVDRGIKVRLVTEITKREHQLL